jgi:CRISPR/Cas system-associated exonuclease Cas4 (RecB family)
MKQSYIQKYGISYERTIQIAKSLSEMNKFYSNLTPDDMISRICDQCKLTTDSEKLLAKDIVYMAILKMKIN